MARFGNALAPGNMLHAAGSFNDGFRALDVFESREAADRVASEVSEAAEAVGLPPPTVAEFETHNLLRS
jgi:hypothetical protein